MIVRIDGLKSADVPIYFEKNVNPEECVYLRFDKIEIVTR